MSDEEIEKNKEKKLAEMMKKQQEINELQETGVMELDSTNFEQTIASESPTLVDFWAEWCGPCRMVGPVVEQLSEEYGDKVNFVKVNIDENNELAQKYNIFSIPTLAIFKNGEIVAQKAGAGSKQSFQTMLDSQIANE